ncbi:MAG: hypothetical protein PHO84_09495, partial [Dysgonamonadaceae bacterium]|nr:hypothetical protein [Dysgonamonadaceae bacterium]
NLSECYSIKGFLIPQATFGMTFTFYELPSGFPFPPYYKDYYVIPKRSEESLCQNRNLFS